jgi:hypothetical protein
LPGADKQALLPDLWASLFLVIPLVSTTFASVHRMLSKLLEHQEAIEAAAIQTARSELQDKYSLVLYDVTTLYFESFKEYDFQKPGFSKDNKPQQPQIVIGLITTCSGFPPELCQLVPKLRTQEVAEPRL